MAYFQELGKHTEAKERLTVNNVKIIFKNPGRNWVALTSGETVRHDQLRTSASDLKTKWSRVKGRPSILQVNGVTPRLSSSVRSKSMFWEKLRKPFTSCDFEVSSGCDGLSFYLKWVR